VSLLADGSMIVGAILNDSHKVLRLDPEGNWHVIGNGIPVASDPTGKKVVGAVPIATNTPFAYITQPGSSKPEVRWVPSPTLWEGTQTKQILRAQGIGYAVNSRGDVVIETKDGPVLVLADNRVVNLSKETDLEDGEEMMFVRDLDEDGNILATILGYGDIYDVILEPVKPAQNPDGSFG
jgi:hypothetical protein